MAERVSCRYYDISDADLLKLCANAAPELWADKVTTMDRLALSLRDARATIATLTQRVEELEAGLRKAEQHRLAERTSRPEWESFLTLKYGEARTILVLLQDGQISVGKACEALAELAHGVPPRIPEPQGEALQDDVIPSQRIAELVAALAEARKDGERLHQERLVLMSQLGKAKMQTEARMVAEAQELWERDGDGDFLLHCLQERYKAAIDAAKEKV